MRIIKFKWSITLALVIGAEALLNRIRRSSSQATAVQALLSLPGWLGGAAGIWWWGAAQLPASPVNIRQVDLFISVTYIYWINTWEVKVGSPYLLSIKY